jgi:serine protease AprX
MGVTVPLIGAPAFRQSYRVSGDGIVIAVIDTEIHLGHPGLVGRIIRRRNYIEEDWSDDPRARPRAPHGTAVAGIIGGRSMPEGVAPGVTIYNYKVLPEDENLPAGDDFDGALAIQHALEDGAHVANCSWGSVRSSRRTVLDGRSREARACNAAWAQGLVIVNSVGNEGPAPSTLTTPSDADGVIAVGATDRTGTIVPDYSGRGPTAHGLQRPHLVAPGGLRNEDLITGCTIFNGFYPAFWGTSFAAAHVSGIAALLLSRNPGLTPDEVRQCLLMKCTPIPNVSNDAQGRGLLKLS